MKNVLIIHNNFNKLGGGENVSLTIAKTLKENGCKIFLLTYNKPPEEVYNLFDNVTYFNSAKTSYGITYICSVLEFICLYYRIFNKYDLMINTNGLFSPFLFADIEYVHYPCYYEDVLFSKSLLLNIYAFPLLLINVLMNFFITNNVILLYNSKYTLAKTKKYLKYINKKSKSDVLYPPVNSLYIYKKSLNYDNRSNIIITISRISPEKKIENIFTLATTLIMNNIKNFKIIVVGRLNDEKYYQYLIEKIKKRSLEKFILFELDVTDERKVSLLSQSKIYFHTLRGEHFGISIVESMAAGLIPIVPNEGGAIEFVPDTYRYDNISESANLVSYYLTNWSGEKAKMIANLALTFDENVFKREFLKWVDLFLQ